MTDNNRAEGTPCWYVKDFADGWIKYTNGVEAMKTIMDTGAIMCWSRDGNPPMTPPDNAEAMRVLVEVVKPLALKGVDGFAARKALQPPPLSRL